MARHGWRLTRLISRLGIKGGQEFDIIPAVQPVLPISFEHNGLVYPLYAPRGIAGKYFLSVPAGERAYCEVQAVADGGALIHALAWSAQTSGNTPSLLKFRVASTRVFPAGAPQVTLQAMGDDMPQTRFYADTILNASVPAGDDYIVSLPSGQSTEFPGPFHIPPGWWFAAWAPLQTADAQIGLTVEDVNVQPPNL